MMNACAVCEETQEVYCETQRPALSLVETPVRENNGLERLFLWIATGAFAAMMLSGVLRGALSTANNANAFTQLSDREVMAASEWNAPSVR